MPRLAIARPSADSKARFLLFHFPGMKLLAFRWSEEEQAENEINALQQALDETYARLRRKAQAEWQRCFTGRDPSDACVRVRIAEDGRPTLAW